MCNGGCVTASITEQTLSKLRALRSLRPEHYASKYTEFLKSEPKNIHLPLPGRKVATWLVVATLASS